MNLATFWFILIAVLWTGYFVLEGFDFGVGILLPFLGRDDGERRVMINTIGPVWDGNEVWLLVAGGATFAAFPEWYATLFSGFYLPLLLILVALIIRGVASSTAARCDEPALAGAAGTWRIVVGSRAARAAVGRGLRQHRRAASRSTPSTSYTGTCFTLLNPYGLLGGLVTLSLFTLHGAMFLALQDRGSAGAPRRTAVRVGAGRRAAGRGLPRRGPSQPPAGPPPASRRRPPPSP